MDFEKAKLDPAAVFKSPQEVFSSQELSLEQKIEILRRREQSATLMEVAEEESMPGPQPKLLQPFATLCTPSTIGRIPSTRAPAKSKNRTAISRDGPLTHSVRCRRETSSVFGFHEQQVRQSGDISPWTSRHACHASRVNYKDCQY